LPLERCQAAQRHFQDGIRLDLVQLVLGHQVGACFINRGGLANDANNFIDMVDGDLQRFEDMQAIFVFLEQVFTPPADNHQAMLRENPQSLFQGQAVRAAIHQSENVDAEGVVHLGAFVERRKDLFRIRVLVEVDHDPHSLPVGFIPQISQTFQAAFA